MTNVGAIQFEMVIDDKSLANEIARVGASFDKSFKNMFNSINKQMSNFTKNTVGQMTGSVNNFSNTATSSNNKVSSSVEKLNSQYSKTQEEIKKVEAELSALESKQYEVFNKFKDMPKLSGDATQAESVDKMMGQDAGYQKLMAESDSLYEKLDALEAKNRVLAEQIRNVGTESESTGQKMSGMGKKSDESSKNIKKVTRETRKLSTELSTGGKKTVHFGSMLNSTFKSILRRLFIYNLIMKGIKGIASAMSSALNTNAQYASSLSLIKTNLKVAFQPIYDFILPAINALMKGLGTATTYIASAISAMFGKTYEQSYAAAKKLDSAKKSMDGYGSAVKKAGKDAKGATASFDTLNTLDL
ncbi:MAG TPA: hypothetical protein GX005_01025, partial [Bacteroidales bacterium]|nr:hypothetical protein [Bacteroidales bacterium]